MFWIMSHHMKGWRTHLVELRNKKKLRSSKSMVRIEKYIFHTDAYHILKYLDFTIVKVQKGFKWHLVDDAGFLPEIGSLFVAEKLRFGDLCQSKNLQDKILNLYTWICSMIIFYSNKKWTREAVLHSTQFTQPFILSDQKNKRTFIFWQVLKLVNQIFN